jgi:hypothetical protein
VAERAGEPALADAARTGDQEIAVLADEVAPGELEEQGALEAASGAIIDVFDAGIVAQLRGPGAGLEALLPAQCHLMFEQQAKPFGMIEAFAVGGLFERLEAFGYAVEAKLVQEIEGRVSEHASVSSVEVAGAANVVVRDHG